MEASYMSRDSLDEEAERLGNSIIKSVEGDVYGDEYGDEEEDMQVEVGGGERRELVDIDGDGRMGRDDTPTPGTK